MSIAESLASAWTAGAPAPSLSFEPDAARCRLRNVSKVLGGQTVVRGVDFTIRPGESVVLLGPSGCGKTTTLRMVAGFLEPDDGEIWINHELSSGSGVMVPTEKRRLGMVFQNYAVWPHKTVYENVAYGLVVARVPSSEARDRVQKALQTVQLRGFEGRYPSELSGGQQQRVALARAIVTEPALLLLDEPLSNLDAGLRQEMRFELKALQQRIAMTALYVTHDQEEAMVLADRIVVMNKGAIEQIGTPQDVYLRPETRFVASFLGATNLIEGRVEAKDVAASRLRIATPLGLPVWARTSREFAKAASAGQEVTVSLRPEAFVPDGPHLALDSPAFDARVENAAFLGNRHEVEVRIRDVPLRAQVRSLAGLEDGRMSFRIDPDSAWVLA